MSLNILIGLILFASHSIFTAIGLLLLKVSFEGVEKYSISGLIDILTIKFFVGLVLYLVAFILSLVILHKFPLGMSVSIMMPLSLVTATLTGYIFLNENISTQTIVGLSFLLAGIFTIYIQK